MTLPPYTDPRQLRVKTAQLPIEARRELKLEIAGCAHAEIALEQSGQICERLRFRVRSHVILEGLPMAPLILIFFGRTDQTGSSPSKVRMFASAASVLEAYALFRPLLDHALLEIVPTS